MPIPSRNQGEGKDTYIARCVAELSGEYPQDQAAAICYNQLKKIEMQEETTPELDPQELENCILSLTGQNYNRAAAMKICVNRLRVPKQQAAVQESGIIDTNQ